MPRYRSGRHHVKNGTNNTQQAAARDEARAAAIAAIGQMADEALEEVLSAPSPQPMEETTPVAPTYEPSKKTMDARRREAIVFKYELLGCPPESEWGKHGGTLRQIADFLKMPDPCDYRPIREVLQRNLAGEDIWYHRGGQERKSKSGRGEQLIAADCLRRGTGQEQAAHILSAWRESKGMTKEEAVVTRQIVRTAVGQLGG